MNKLILHCLPAANLMRFLVASTLFVVGCEPADKIETYEIPKEAVAEPAAKALSGEATDRMLAAIVPDGDKAWFFKIVGPAAEIDARVAEINKFFASIRAASGKPVPAWELPNGWTEQGATGMRAATLLVPATAKPIELAITSLPWNGSPAEILSNVNRWRGQLQLAPVDAQGLTECTRSIDAGDLKVTVVDLQGRMQAGGTMAPFAGGGAMQRQPAAPAAATDGGPLLPPGHPPISGDAGAGSMQRTSGSSPLKFETPSGWFELPPSGMRKAAFGIENGEEQALVTVIDFPVDAGPMMADPLENTNRWRREVGLEPIARDALDTKTEAIKIDGAEGRLVDAVPDPSTAGQAQADRATLAVMVQKGRQMWFIKLTGSRDLVAGQRDNFRTFLQSLHFTNEGGATDGN